MGCLSTGRASEVREAIRAEKHIEFAAEDLGRHI